MRPATALSESEKLELKLRTAQLENTALRQRVGDLEVQLKNMQSSLVLLDGARERGSSNVLEKLLAYSMVLARGGFHGRRIVQMSSHEYRTLCAQANVTGAVGPEQARMANLEVHGATGPIVCLPSFYPDGCFVDAAAPLHVDNNVRGVVFPGRPQGANMDLYSRESEPTSLVLETIAYDIVPRCAIRTELALGRTYP